MPTTFNELAFSPSVNEVLDQQRGRGITVFTGRNNSGKSAYLKKMSVDRSKLYIGVNRFYSFHHLPLYQKNDLELDNWFSSMSMQSVQPYTNFEGSFFNFNTAITRLTDSRRATLFEVFEEIFGQRADVQSEAPENVFSNRFVAIDGESLSVTSSGTRLFLGILAALMDERFSVVAIDEPELGLSPVLQAKLAKVIVGKDGAERLLPHNPHIVISTHSHNFLDKINPTNNLVVNRRGNLITAERCSGLRELNEIQFRLLGNDLGSLFLPDAVLLVEGDTDKLYMSRVLELLLPNYRFVIESCGGDIAARLQYWAAMTGDFQVSPYRQRTFVVYDSIKQAGLERICNRLGIPHEHRIEWSGNGIEFLYPPSLLSMIYRSPITDAATLNISGDRVSAGEVEYTKMELARMVAGMVGLDTALPEELGNKLIAPLRNALSYHG